MRLGTSASGMQANSSLTVIKYAKQNLFFLKCYGRRVLSMKKLSYSCQWRHNSSQKYVSLYFVSSLKKVKSWNRHIQKLINKTS